MDGGPFNWFLTVRMGKTQFIVFFQQSKSIPLQKITLTFFSFRHGIETNGVVYIS